MRNSVALALVLALMLFFGLAANAQNQITLNGTASGNFNFTSTGTNSSTGYSNLNLSLGTCSYGAACITGTATGTGNLASTGTYIISGGPLSLSNTSNGNWDVSSGSLNFNYFNGGGTLLAGTLNLVSLTQAGSLGLFNDQLNANLTNLSGSLAPQILSVGNAAESDITIVIKNGVNLSTLATNSSDTATISSGEIFPTPEPASMFLFGSGLMMVGTFLRRRS